MSDYRAIGGVSATLRTLLQDRMEVVVPISVGLPPYSSRDIDPHQELARVNLFLYRVTENGHLQNQEIPGRGASGAYGHPPLSLNLHYLVTAYGSQENPAASGMFDDTTAHFLLGSAMRVLHDAAVITDRMTTVRPPSGAMVLHDSLRDEFEHVKLTLEPLTLEDITKVWTAIALRFRLSAGYVVNVVQIESRRPRRFPRPVGQPLSATIPPLPTDPPGPGPMVYVPTIQTPTVTDIRVRRAGQTVEQPVPYARIGDTLIFRGTSLSGPITSIGIGDLMLPATFARPERVEADIPDSVIPGVGPISVAELLQPGVVAARVIVSDPLVPHRSAGSNAVPIMIVPSVASAVPAVGPPRTVTITGRRLVGANPGGEVIIGRSVVARSAYTSTAPTQLTVPLPDILPTRGVQVIASAPVAATIALGGGIQTLNITIGTTTRTITANLTSPIDRAAAPGFVAGLIRDALPLTPDARFSDARVDLWSDQLIVVPGGLVDPITIESPVGLSFAQDLGLAAAIRPPLAGAGFALLSGVLDSPPPLSSLNPRVTLQIGAQGAIVVPVPKTTSLQALADALQTSIRNTGTVAEYRQARVGVSGWQLLVIPGAAGMVAFAAAPGDTTTVAELQLHADVAVRVRVDGAESIDDIAVGLPL